MKSRSDVSGLDDARTRRHTDGRGGAGRLFGGDPTVNCAVCGAEIPEKSAVVFPRGAKPGRSRILKCAECAGVHDP